MPRARRAWGILLSPYCRPVDFLSLAPCLRAQARQEVNQTHDLIVLEGLGRHRHRPVEVRGGPRLEGPQEPQQVGEVLPGQARGLLLAGEPGPVARRAVMLLREPLPS